MSDQPNTATPPALAHVVRFWANAAAQLEPIQAELAQLYREADAAGIMERRALNLGVMLGYLESIMAKQPQRIAECGSLYARLVESERRAWDAARKERHPRDAGSPDLAQLANRRA